MFIRYDFFLKNERGYRENLYQRQFFGRSGLLSDLLTCWISPFPPAAGSATYWICLFPVINRIPVIRILEVRATVIFTSKIHALNT
jgi:hypothetical protein